MATATDSSHSSFPKSHYLFSLWISKEIRFMQPDCLPASVKPEGREQARCHTSPGNPIQHTAACVWGINSSKAEQSARLTQGPREERACTWLCARTLLHAMLLHAQPYQRDIGEILESGGWVEGGEGREKSVMRSTIKVQKKIRTHSFCFWQTFKC